MSKEGKAAQSALVTPFRFSFLVREHGWAEADFVAPEGPTHLSASYLGDALGSLLKAVNRILAGEEAASAKWHEEPGYFRWAFTRVGAALELRIWVQDGTAGLWIGPERDSVEERGRLAESGDLGDEAPESLLLHTSGEMRQLALSIVVGTQNVLTDVGEVNYWIRWSEHPFPKELLRSAQKQLGIEPRPDVDAKDDRFDPLLPEMIQRWWAFLRGKLDRETFGKWAQDKLGMQWRDEIAHDGLQRMNDAYLSYDGSMESKQRHWMAFRDWRKEVAKFSGDPTVWNRSYYRDYLERLIAGVSDSAVPRFAAALMGTLSEADIAEIVAKRLS